MNQKQKVLDITILQLIVINLIYNLLLKALHNIKNDQMYEYFISLLQRPRIKRSWNMRYWMPLKRYLKNTMDDLCLTCTHFAEPFTAKNSYPIEQIALLVSVPLVIDHLQPYVC